MDRQHDYYSSSHRKGFWSYLGYLALGILGILLGAALVYGMFAFYVFPVAEKPPVEEEVNDIEETPVPTPVPDEEMADLVEQIMPAVVGVTSLHEIPFFGERQLEEMEAGSGVIVSADGYIVTNQHVIERAEEVAVVIPDKGRYEAEVVGSDLLTDLALLKIEETDLAYASLGDSGVVRPGETVMAIGNPLGLQQTVTAGIISAVERQVMIPGTEYAYTFIQTDAVVNPGNSGGPLLNMQGEVVGINTAKIALPGVEGIGLSIPSDTVNRVIGDFVEHGKVLRPHMGVVIEDWLDYEEEPPVQGVRLVQVVPDSPADEAGLLDGDIIVAIDDQDIDYLAKLFDKLLVYYPGDTVNITFYRNGEQNETDLTLGERPEELPLFEEEELEEELEEFWEFD